MHVFFCFSNDLIVGAVMLCKRLAKKADKIKNKKNDIYFAQLIALPLVSQIRFTPSFFIILLVLIQQEMFIEQFEVFFKKI